MLHWFFESFSFARRELFAPPCPPSYSCEELAGILRIECDARFHWNALQLGLTHTSEFTALPKSLEYLLGTPDFNGQSRAPTLVGLGRNLNTVTRDLNEPISKNNDAVSLTPDGHSDKPRRLNNLGYSLQARFERLGDFSDLNESILKRKYAVSLTPDGHPDKPEMLENLGRSLKLRFERFGNIGDLNKSISKRKDAVLLTPDGHPDKPARFNNLGTSLIVCFEQLGDSSALNESISRIENALNLIPDGHPNKPSWLCNLGNCLVHRFNLSYYMKDFQYIITQYTSAAYSHIGPAHVRFHAAKMWVHGAKWIQHPSLLEDCEVVRDTAAGAISFGQPVKAVEWLEQGRSIIWGQLLNLRSPFDALKENCPMLAEELIVLSTQLEFATTRRGDEELPDLYPSSLSRVLLLTKIRELEGFQRFLLPKTITELSQAAQKGPVVFLNVSRSSCDALALLPGLTEEFFHVELPEFTPDHVKTLTQSLGRLLLYMGRSDIDKLHGQQEGPAAGLEDDFAHILSELWVRLVKPVLDVFAIATPMKTHLLRIWWCPTGPLTFFTNPCCRSIWKG
ncbi:hypothetical protein DFH09DRAFT_1068697 [Mycena vulgaris]|nr:hypothetical protein DFH09DRAFT_1068697 [Mycena vulgaris]